MKIQEATSADSVDCAPEVRVRAAQLPVAHDRGVLPVVESGPSRGPVVKNASRPASAAPRPR